MPTAYQMLHEGTYDPLNGEVREWSYWDTFTLAAGTNEFTLFSIPKGQGGKKFADTNFPLAGVIPDYMTFAADAIQMIVIPNAVLSQANYFNYLAFLEQTTIYLDIENKADMWRFTLAEVMGVTDPLIVTGAAAGDQLSARAPSKGLRPLFVPSVFAANTPMNVVVSLDTASNAALDDFKIKVIMKGAKKSSN